MKRMFRRELALYAEAHRDRVNGVMHIIGNPIIFIGVVMPLSLVPVTLFGFRISLAPLLVIPALLLWMAWDFGLGLGIALPRSRCFGLQPQLPAMSASSGCGLLQ